ncbi:acyltransferase [Psychroserpens ponticola]|uniref:Acyltransferase n=1 Tax=Psychroserpens ponticola TaxID=2932268 RepID=A0ABY7RUN5_9FLAO|nr:acyltransferase [Psychroserpens ponticola]WCO00832.1 acyltransferase [Psychroserpens ponticola]
MMIKHYATKIILKVRKLGYKCFNTNKNISGKYTAIQPVVFRGKGSVVFGKHVKFGIVNSPMFYNTYAYIEARQPDSKIVFGNNVSVNNNFSITSEKSIIIKDDVLIGYNCHISDSNFHDLNPGNRLNTDLNPKEVSIGKNVFIGNNVTILKGVVLGENLVVAAGSVVTKSFSKNLIIGGVPAKIISELP